MSWLSRIFHLGSHKSAGPVARPHKGDGAADAESLYGKLDAMKAERGVPHAVPRDAYGATQGMAKELVKLAMSDGKVSSTEMAALADIADQRYDHYGNSKPNDLPLIGYTEAMEVLRPVVIAPNAEAREWWAKLASQEKPTVTLAMARELGVILLKDSSFDGKDRQFLSESMHQNYSGISFTREALTFLGYLGKSERDLLAFKEDPRGAMTPSQRQLVADTLAFNAHYLPGKS